MDSLQRQIELRKQAEINERARYLASLNSVKATAVRQSGIDSSRYMSASSPMPSLWWDDIPVDSATIKYSDGVISLTPSLSDNAGKYLRVNMAGSGLEWGTVVSGSGTMVYPSAGIAVSSGSSWSSSILDKSSEWNTAYGWGDHSTAGYAPIASPVFTTSFGFATSKWRIVENGNNMELKFNDVLKAYLDNSGNIAFTGEVTAFYTP